ncbi:type II toxin-antitoxin system HipA family toxin YjjJ [Yersinia mollaretii]|uniref:Type II toxin-antitoxin system HipA family toxin YjjJ n=1 Tax=Yersinia mollaretii TaxID=33060 RepID=A0AA44HZJ4_YERMO|nr:type II toxin-antitoxin system HipA family toxin YjjJ [Yersinia mollaretii]NIL22351.1 type II toxin-antitoxin system HipA family toxin YjjJ [Yersinia mollaretii]CNI53609.1 putative DNA-binding transcriptional regulator [Yersinia mollaretii]
MLTLETLLRQGPATAAHLADAMKISQPTVSRQLSGLKEKVLKIGKARSTQYALRRSGVGDSGEAGKFPLYRIDERGHAAHFATLYLIHPAEKCCVHQLESDTWQQFDSLPWYLTDMRPQGFLGRIWGKSVAAPLQLTDDVRLWNEDHILLALSRQADDMNGNILIGQQSYQRWLAAPDAIPIEPANKLSRYTELSQTALAGEMVGSSAGGEQPKFTCYAGFDGASPSYVIVKFTAVQDNPNAQRWADLLIAESLALNTLRDAGYAAAVTHVLHNQDRQTFLEVERFDRYGQRGRVGMVSLEAVNAEFVGMPVVSWPKVCRELAAKGLLSLAQLEQVRLIWAFGVLIANTDMHHGNLSFLHPEHRPFSLAPIYDMLPMAFAPSGTGNMRHTVPNITLSVDISREHWLRAQELAQPFWQKVSTHPDISAGFKTIADQMQEKIASLTPLIERMA